MENLLDYSDSDGESAQEQASRDSESSCSEQCQEDNPSKDTVNQGTSGPSSGGAKLGLLSAADLFAIETDTVHVKPPPKEFTIAPSDPDEKPGTI